MKPDKEKMRAIASCPIPKTKRQVKAFLGLENFYNRFIPGFSTKAAPLSDLVHNDNLTELIGQTRRTRPLMT